MLTRIEIDGFKSFEKFAVDLAPLTVIVGANASGKSNLFDAIQFISHLASSDVRSAAKNLRGDAYELFRQVAPEQQATEMHFAVELLLQPEWLDPWGKPVQLSHTRVRYEVSVCRRLDDSGRERLEIASERMVPLLKKNDLWKAGDTRLSSLFQETFMRYRRQSPFLDTDSSGGVLSFKIHQDGGAGRNRPANAASSTVLSTMSTADFPHLYAVREELRAWRLLQLNPAGLRHPSPFLVEDDHLLSDGSNLAAVLHRIREESRTEMHPNGLIHEIAASLGGIVPGVVGLSVEAVDSAKEYRASLKMRNGHSFPSSVASDGTLRVLALLTMMADPRETGLVCFEEPENGIHPARLKMLLQHIREWVAPLSGAAPSDRPLSQILLNSHSPVALAEFCRPGGGEIEQPLLLFSDTVTVTGGGTPSRTKTRMRPLADPSLLVNPDPAKWALAGEVKRYLDTVNSEA